MRHINLAPLLTQIFSDAAGQKAKKSLERAQERVAKKRTLKTKKKYVDNNGSGKWKPIKDRLTAQLGRKCWYTEEVLSGASLTVDHFRPVCHYWWLAFDPENYRVACPWANSPEHNGGKGENFPLLPAAAPRATSKELLANERPVILDPCIAADCALLAFEEADGRPVIHPLFKHDAISVKRVEQSKILLNLDHPDFNKKRALLGRDIRDDVAVHEALPADSPERTVRRARIKERLGPSAPFSTAARFYLQLHRHLDWVEDILRQS